MTDSATRQEIGGEIAQLLFEGALFTSAAGSRSSWRRGWASSVMSAFGSSLATSALRQAVTHLAVRYVNATLPQASIEAGFSAGGRLADWFASATPAAA